MQQYPLSQMPIHQQCEACMLCTTLRKCRCKADWEQTRKTKCFTDIVPPLRSNNTHWQQQSAHPNESAGWEEHELRHVSVMLPCCSYLLNEPVKWENMEYCRACAMHCAHVRAACSMSHRVCHAVRADLCAHWQGPLHAANCVMSCVRRLLES